MFRKFIRYVHSILVLAVAVQSISAGAQPMMKFKVNSESFRSVVAATNDAELPPSTCTDQEPMNESLPDDDRGESEEDPSLELDQMIPDFGLSGWFDLISLRLPFTHLRWLQIRPIQPLPRPPQA